MPVRLAQNLLLRTHENGADEWASTMNFSQLVEVLLGRWRTVVLATALLAATGFMVSSLLPKKYTPSAAVLVDVRGADALNSTSPDRSLSANQAMMTTQVDLIGSDRVARRVVEMLKLDSEGALRQRWVDETGGQGDATNFIAQLLLRKLEVKPSSRDSNIISIAYAGSNAKGATEIVNAFARASIDANLELKIEPARQFASWFDERIRTLRNELGSAQRRLTAYQRQQGVVTAAAGQIDVENAKLAQLAAQLVQIQAARSESNSRQAQARSNARTSPDVLSNGVISGLRSSIASSETNLQQLGTQYGDRHPQVVTAREQLASLRAQLELEMQAVARSVTTSNTVNEQREQEARLALDAQRSRVLALMNGSNDVAILQRDVESAQRALDAATTRQSQTSLESQVRQTNVFLLAPAVEPSSPSGPKVALYTASAAALGLVIGLALALWQEARTPLIRSVDDLALVLDLPVLVTLPRAMLQIGPPSPRRQANRIVPS